LALQCHFIQTIFGVGAHHVTSNRPAAIMKILIAVAFILIIASLGSALFFMMRDKSKTNRTVKALTYRVGFSVALFILILLANYFGLIQPTGIR
jgi:FtsH-binding integral membrane protein